MAGLAASRRTWSLSIGGRASARPASDQIAAIIGTIDPKTAVTDERVYIRAFFDKDLRNRDNHLLDGPSPRFPDIQFEH